MPQMALLLWLNLYMFFTVMLALIIISSYFIKTPIKTDPNVAPMKTDQANWKWWQTCFQDLSQSPELTTCL